MEGIEAGQQGERGEAAGGAGGVSEGTKVPPEPRDWSDEEKGWIVQESFGPGTTVEDVAARHGVPARRLSYWRKLARRGELVVPPASASEGGFALTCPPICPHP